MIRDATLSDAKPIVDIYNFYIINSTATFEEESIAVDVMKSRIQNVISNLPWLVYEDDDKIQGYAYATPWKQRSAYRNSVEISVYVKHDAQKMGIGTKLYTELISKLAGLKKHAIIGGITLPNDPSIRLHEKLGFRKVAEFEEVGYKFGKWLNVGYWQLIN